WFGSSVAQKFVVEISEDKKNVKVTIPTDIYLVEDLQLRLFMLAEDIINFVIQDGNVSFVENFNKEVFS
ncbi:MAG: peptidylprolyl isomerase, partial [Stygiolobus sp.]|nr:peptidylprolyl isomerase [Stygiolobus sp.]